MIATSRDSVVEILYAMKLLPYRVEFLAATGELVMDGTSPLFAECEPGALPEYTIEVHEDTVEGKPAIKAVHVQKV
jgi:hypothetical protein